MGAVGVGEVLSCDVLNPNYRWPHQLDVKFWTKFLHIGFLKIYLFLQKRIPNLFGSDMMLENDVLTSILRFYIHFDVFSRRSQSHRESAGPPLPSGFTAIIDHPSMGEAGMWSTVQCGASQYSNQFLVLGRGKCGGRRVLCPACSLALSRCSNVAAPFWADFRNRSALLRICQRPGEVSWHLVKVRP